MKFAKWDWLKLSEQKWIASISAMSTADQTRLVTTIVKQLLKDASPLICNIGHLSQDELFITGARTIYNRLVHFRQYLGRTGHLTDIFMNSFKRFSDDRRLFIYVGLYQAFEGSLILLSPLKRQMIQKRIEWLEFELADLYFNRFLFPNTRHVLQDEADMKAMLATQAMLNWLTSAARSYFPQTMTFHQTDKLDRRFVIFLDAMAQ